MPGNLRRAGGRAREPLHLLEFQLNINNQPETIIGTTPGATSRQGAEVYLTNADAAVGGYGARGSWAVTAP